MYICIFVDQVEIVFLETRKHKPLVWFRYNDDGFFIWTHGKEKHSSFLEDRPQFLHYKFSHPNHTKRSTAFSQGLRVSMVCSDKSGFFKYVEKMKSSFLVRGYPTNLVENEMKKVKCTSKNRNTKRDNSLKAVPFVMTYQPKLMLINKVILKYLYLLYIDKEDKRVFTPKLMISLKCKEAKHVFSNGRICPYRKNRKIL